MALSDYYARLRAWGCVWVLGCYAAGLSLPVLNAATPAEDPRVATTSAAARDAATKVLTSIRFTPAAQKKVSSVLEDVSLYRRLPRQTIDCEPDLYLHLIRNPELVVNMWTTLGVTKMVMDRVGQGVFQVQDGEGTKGSVELLASSDELQVIYSEGSYTGPLYPRTVRGRSLILLRSKYHSDARGRMLVSSDLDFFLAIENFGVDLVARTFAPSIGKAADHNFAETALFASKLSRTAETNEPALIRLTEKLQRVTPESKENFLRVASLVDDKLAAVRADTEQRQQEQVSAAQQAASGSPVVTHSSNATVPRQPAGRIQPVRTQSPPGHRAAKPPVPGRK
ncbi:MAG: hypothetical protein SFX18_09280 [Pirellulales bacterium]|nr:hypothetical protein [Pirellulales bacterium]